MPVLACTGARNENNFVCIRLYWCMYWLYLGLFWSVLNCIGVILVNVLASTLACIEKIGMYLVCIGTYHYVIHPKYRDQQNKCQYMLVYIGM